MDIIHVDELRFPIGNGSTEPCFGISNNVPIVVKTYNNIQGNKVLVNELICYLIAQKLQLTIPRCGICLIDKNTIIDENVANLDSFSPDDNLGLGFYSEFIPKYTVLTSPSMIKFASNYQWLIPRIMLFDHLIYNKDRNKGNLLLNTGKGEKKLHIIDHTHTFNLECLWTGNDLNRLISENDCFNVDIMECNSYLYSMFKTIVNLDILTMSETLNFFKNNLNHEFFSDIINKIPLEWENNKTELEALGNYLIHRFNNLNIFCDIITSFEY